MRTNEQIIHDKIKGGKLYYITQYTEYERDIDYYSTLINYLDSNFTSQALEETEVNYIMDQLEILINDKMPNVIDLINKKVYYTIFKIKSSNDIERLIDLYDAIISEDIDGLENVTGVFYDFMSDQNILTPDVWEDIADNDLRENGKFANCLYWINKVNYKFDFLQMNAYENGFHQMDAADVIHEFLTDYYDFNNSI